jgi:uncharacterized membrane-anchored protein YhcB (DUF1043 family)
MTRLIEDKGMWFSRDILIVVGVLYIGLSIHLRVRKAEIQCEIDRKNAEIQAQYDQIQRDLKTIQQFIQEQSGETQ